MVFKLATEADKYWRRMNGSKIILEVLKGTKFVDRAMEKAV